MPEYIDKETVLQDMAERYDCYNPEIEADRNIRKGLIFARMIIDKQSTADVQEIKHGKWEYDSGDVGYTNYLCSECKNFLTFYEEIDLYPYCPYCGAKMEVENG
jgi:DNA-directed RNA polymerase subunit RPC12/RpoP